jgi:hypothetical protein
MTRDEIIKAVDDYSRASGLAPSTICQYALRNRKVYERITQGGNIGLASIERLMSWMRANPPK